MRDLKTTGDCSFNGLAAALDQRDLFSEIRLFSMVLRNCILQFFYSFVTASKQIELQKPD